MIVGGWAASVQATKGKQLESQHEQLLRLGWGKARWGWLTKLGEDWTTQVKCLEFSCPDTTLEKRYIMYHWVKVGAFILAYKKS